ncbi:class I SAM-dependent methyltransferase [Candidatus Woesearchaeota archaeon]|jgi:ubiquinone/menaquinone biosynthesis C-methylase UbiE|nr:class I SAM-dependent methyltransferase [Candidatus Woesearchaeota archaeon]MBT6023453.1 class I SAM-dependent methyltransferase [Candidatus Woesearchaeota archaeon]
MKRLIKKQWDKISSIGTYRRNLGIDLSKYVSGRNLKILDLGSGGRRGLDKFGKVIYSDISLKMLQQGELSTGVNLDASSLPFKDASFDVVTSIAMFHHLPTKKDRLNFLKEVRRVLKPGGISVIKFGFILGEAESQIKVKWANVDRFYYSMSLEGLKKIVEKVFSNYRVKMGEYSSREVKYSKNHVEKVSKFGNYELVLRK